MNKKDKNQKYKPAIPATNCPKDVAKSDETNSINDKEQDTANKGSSHLYEFSLSVLQYFK